MSHGASTEGNYLVYTSKTGSWNHVNALAGTLACPPGVMGTILHLGGIEKFTWATR